MKKFLSLFLILLFNTHLFALSETEIKAVFLEKFTHLIEWPESSNQEFLICVLNDEAFVQTMQKVYKDKTFNSKPVRILSLSDKDKLPASCRLLFIGRMTTNTQKLTTRLAKEPVLTISDHQEFLADNIMITVYLDNKRFKYIINNKAAQDANIKISYLLLKSAQKVIK